MPYSPDDLRRLVDTNKRKFDSCSALLESIRASQVVDDDAMRYLTTHTKVSYGGKKYSVSELDQPGQRVISLEQTVTNVVSAAGSYCIQVVGRNPPAGWDGRLTAKVTQALDDAPSIPVEDLEGMVKISLCAANCYIVYTADWSTLECHASSSPNRHVQYTTIRYTLDVEQIQS